MFVNRIDRLEERGLVHREPDPSDRRGVRVVLTETGRTTVGVSGLDMPAAGALLASALDGELPPAQALKEAIDDLRAYYLEAASAFPDPGTPKMRKAWLWDETLFGKALLTLQPKLAASTGSRPTASGNHTAP